MFIALMDKEPLKVTVIEGTDKEPITIANKKRLMKMYLFRMERLPIMTHIPPETAMMINQHLPKMMTDLDEGFVCKK